MKMHVGMLTAAAFFVSACAAPGKVDKPRDEMSQREKDSVLAVSGLPGAGVVKKAMAMSDEEQRQQAAEDSVSKEN